MTTATAAYPRGSMYGMVLGRTPPRWLPDAGRAVAVLAAVLAYFGVRGLTGRDPAVALDNARRVMSIERLLHLHAEQRLQQLVAGHDTTTHLLNRIYIFGHWPVIAATLLGLLLRHRDTFLRVRTAMLLSGAAGLVVFAVFPVAPPRLADPSLIDTVTLQSSAYRVLQPPAFTNQYAAMPSLHVGWNLLITTAILAATTRLWLRVAAVALTLAMDATVVLTANHYILDGIAGAALAGVAWHLAGRFATTSAGPQPTPARHRANPARHRSNPARRRAGSAVLGGDAAGPRADFAGTGGAAAPPHVDLAGIGGAAALPHIDLAGLRGDAAEPRAKSAGPRANSAGPRTKLAGPCAKHTGTRAMPATPMPARPAATGVADAGGSGAARAGGADASATVAAEAGGGAGTTRARTVRRLLPRTVAGAVVIVIAVELALGWSSLTAALAQLRAPRPGWLAAGLALEIAAMSAYARMQRRLLRSAGVRAPLRRHIALAYAAHSLSVTLPGGAAFSTRLNYQQMRSFGAGPAAATWAIAFSGILSTAGLALVSAASAVAAGGTPQWRTLVGLTLAGGLLVLGIRWITANPDRLEPLARAGLVRANRLLRRPRDHRIDQVRGFVDQLRAARLSPGHGAAAIGHSVLNWLFDAAALWMCLRAVSDDPPRATQVLLAFCAGMAAGGITIVPGGLGIIDSALIVALVTTGAGSATAIAAVVLYRILTLGFIVGTGWIAWLAVRRKTGTDTPAQPGPAARSAVDQPSPRPAVTDVGRHAFGEAATRHTPANQPTRPFARTTAGRPASS